MNSQRFNGIKIDLDGLSDPEKQSLAIYTAQRAAKALGEMAILDQAFGEGYLPDNVVVFPTKAPDLPPAA